MKNILTLSVFGALLLTACGSNLRPMSQNEKDRFKTVMGSIGKSATALSSLGKTGPSNNVMQGLRSLAGSAKSEKDAREMSDRLVQAVNRGECSYMNNIPADFTSGKITSLKDAKFTLNGPRCPVDIELTMTVSGSPTDSSADFRLKYESRDAEYTELADIDRLDLTGTFKLKMVTPTETSARFEMDFEMILSGKAHSQSEGEFKPYLRARMGAHGDTTNPQGLNGSGEFVFGLEMKDFTGEIKAVQELRNDPNAKPKFYLNGEELTQEQLTEWLSETPFPTSSSNN